MILPQRGGCLCGDVRYRLTDEPLTVYACHCTDCQRQTGTSFVLSMFVKRAALELERGELREYSLEMPDGRPKSGRFCGRCSTRLWGEPARFPQLAVLRPGTLDDTSWVHPIGHIWTRSAQPWIRLPEESLRFEGQPDAEGVAELVRAWKEHLHGA